MDLLNVFIFFDSCSNMVDNFIVILDDNDVVVVVFVLEGFYCIEENVVGG